MFRLPIYVVSLPEDKERRLRLSEEFPSTYPRFNFVEAIDMRGQHLENCMERTDSLLPAELGCSLSHIKVLTRFLETDSECCLILEDDIIGGDRSIEDVERSLKYLPKDFLVICGGQQGLRNRSYLRGYETDFCGLYKVFRCSRRFVLRTCCYLLSRSAAETILATQYKKIFRADDWHILLRDFDNLFFLNVLSHPEDLSCSHIESERRPKETAFLRRALNDGIGKVTFNIILKIIIVWYSLFRKIKKIDVG
jgi:glycosyl transferase, family 25